MFLNESLVKEDFGKKNINQSQVLKNLKSMSNRKRKAKVSKTQRAAKARAARGIGIASRADTEEDDEVDG